MVLDGLATSVYLPLFRHVTKIPTQIGMASPMHSRLLDEPTGIFTGRWRYRCCGTGGLLQSNQSRGGDSIGSG